MKIRKISCLLALFCLSMSAEAAIELQATYTDKNGVEETTSKDFNAEAPLHVHFTPLNVPTDEGTSIEWHFSHPTSGTHVTRYDTETDYTFVLSGINKVTLYQKKGNETVDSASINITITESHLEMPNAFSPNNDGTNDVYRAKQDKYKSIVEFHAYIFNRHGQKLFEWTDITKGWDGTYKGSPVKDGVYFVYVKARGADGVEYNIRRDVNLIRNFNETTKSNNE